MDADNSIEKEVISFIPSEESNNPSFIEVKYTIAGSGFKTQLPVFKGGSAEDFLRFLNKFSNAKTKLGYTNYQKLQNGIEQLLQGTAKDEWSTIKGTAQPGINMLNSFNDRLEAFRQIYIPEPAAMENQKSYLQRIRKTDKLTVPHFLDRLKQINLFLSQFPGSNPQQYFNNEELKRIFYFAMPNRWRTNFINSDQSLHMTTLEALKTYIVHQEQTDTHRRKNKENNKRNGQGRNFNKRSRQNNNSSLTNKFSPTQGQSKKRKKRLDNDNDCPIHGSVHKWGQCHQNQYGENFKSRRQSNHSSSNSHFNSQVWHY